MADTATLRDRPVLTPVMLVKIEPLVSAVGVLRFSDRVITINYQTVEMYEDYLLEVSGMADEIALNGAPPTNSECRIKLKNDPIGRASGQYDRLSDLIESGGISGAPVTISEALLDDDGNAATDGPEVRFVGVVDDMAEITEDYISLRCSSRPFCLAQRWQQPQLDTATFPNIKDDHGGGVPYVYGAMAGKWGRVPCVKTDHGGVTTLMSEISAASTTIYLTDGADFPATGQAGREVWIGEERIAYTARANNVLTGLTRGSGSTTAASHPAGADVIQYRTTHEHLISAGQTGTLASIYGTWKGTPIQISGATLVYRGGNSYVSLPSKVAINPLADTLALAVVRPPSARVIRRPILPSGTQFPAAPLLGWQRGKLQFKVSVFVPAGTILAGTSTLSYGASTILTVYPSGAVVGLDGSSVTGATSYEFRTTAWNTTFPISSTVYSGVVFYVDEVWQEGEFLAAGDWVEADPGGGEISLASASVPLRVVAGATATAGTITWPSMPAGTGAVSHAWAEIEFTSSSTMIAALAGSVAISITGLGAIVRHRNSSRSEPSGVVSYFTRWARNGGRVVVPFTPGTWPTSTSISVGALPVNGSIAAVTFTVTKATLCAVVASERSSIDVTKTGGIALAGLIDRVYVNTNGIVGTGTRYGGTGTMARPDHLIRHWLQERLGFADAEIDIPSWNAAGTFYSTAGPGGTAFTIAGWISGDVDPQAVPYLWAHEARSYLWYSSGLWHLFPIPDVWGNATVAVNQADIIGLGATFRFSQTSRPEAWNTATVRSSPNYGWTSGETPWGGSDNLATPAPANPRDIPQQPATLEYSWLRSSANSLATGARHLRRNRFPYLLAEFGVSWEYHAVNVGSLITLTGGLYPGRKWFVFHTERVDGSVLNVRCLECD